MTGHGIWATKPPSGGRRSGSGGTHLPMVGPHTVKTFGAEAAVLRASALLR